MDKYIQKAYYSSQACRNPEEASITLLTAVELFVAFDKLVMKEIPMLANYSPEIPLAFLEKLLLWKTTSLYWLARAYRYLYARQSQSRQGWSLLSGEFTEYSFAVRYYDQSPHLQQLKARIENQQRLSLAEEAKASESPLPSLPLHARLWYLSCNARHAFVSGIPPPPEF